MSAVNNKVVHEMDRLVKNFQNIEDHADKAETAGDVGLRASDEIKELLKQVTKISGKLISNAESLERKTDVLEQETDQFLKDLVNAKKIAEDEISKLITDLTNERKEHNRAEGFLKKEKADHKATKELLSAEHGEHMKDETALKKEREALKREREAHKKDEAALEIERAEHKKDEGRLAMEKEEHRKDEARLVSERAEHHKDEAALAKEKTAHGQTQKDLKKANDDLSNERSAHVRVKKALEMALAAETAALIKTKKDLSDEQTAHAKTKADLEAALAAEKKAHATTKEGLEQALEEEKNAHAVTRQILELALDYEMAAHEKTLKERDDFAVQLAVLRAEFDKPASTVVNPFLEESSAFKNSLSKYCPNRYGQYLIDNWVGKESKNATNFVTAMDYLQKFNGASAWTMPTKIECFIAPDMGKLLGLRVTYDNDAKKSQLYGRTKDSSGKDAVIDDVDLTNNYVKAVTIQPGVEGIASLLMKPAVSVKSGVHAGANNINSVAREMDTDDDVSPVTLKAPAGFSFKGFYGNFGDNIERLGVVWGPDAAAIPTKTAEPATGETTASPAKPIATEDTILGQTTITTMTWSDYWGYEGSTLYADLPREAKISCHLPAAPKVYKGDVCYFPVRDATPLKLDGDDVKVYYPKPTAGKKFPGGGVVKEKPESGNTDIRDICFLPARASPKIKDDTYYLPAAPTRKLKNICYLPAQTKPKANSDVFKIGNSAHGTVTYSEIIET